MPTPSLNARMLVGPEEGARYDLAQRSAGWVQSQRGASARSSLSGRTAGGMADPGA
jgi:hypothetical protein